MTFFDARLRGAKELVLAEMSSVPAIPSFFLAFRLKDHLGIGGWTVDEFMGISNPSYWKYLALSFWECLAISWPDHYLLGILNHWYPLVKDFFFKISVGMESNKNMGLDQKNGYHFQSWRTSCSIPSGNLLHSYWTLPIDWWFAY